MVHLGYSRPTLYRYLKILKDAGLLMSSRNASVTLGPKVVEMDYLARRSDTLVLSGQPHLKGADNALLPQCDDPALVRKQDPLRGVRNIRKDLVSSYPRGRPMPLGRGAIARSIMAYLPRARLVP